MRALMPSGRLVIAAALCLAGPLLWLGASPVVVHELTHRRAPRRAEPRPDLAWAQAEEVFLSTSDGQSLGAWSFDSGDGRPWLVLLHGNGGSRWRRSCW